MMAEQDHVAKLSKISPDMVSAVSAEVAVADLRPGELLR